MFLNGIKFSPFHVRSLYLPFLLLLALCLAARGQVVLDDGGLSQDGGGVLAPLEAIELAFPPATESQDLPALQPDFVAPPLADGNFPASLAQEEAASRTAVLRLDAHLSPQTLPLTRGLVWRVFSAEIGFDNQLPLMDSKQGGMAEFHLTEGNYFVHVAFGRVEAIRKLELEAGRTYYENIELNAGGLVLNVEAQGGDVNKNRVRFSIYEQGDNVSPQLLMVEDVKPDMVVRLKAGSYHVVSTYGDANAIASADIRVEAGKLTQAAIEHRAAQVTLKLVREAGGEAQADTRWVLMNESGDTVRELANPHMDIVLVEGDYIAYARNRERSYAREFSVSAGKDMEIDLLMGRDGVDESTF